MVEQYSIDEAWVDMTGTTGLYGPPVLAAQHLKDRIFRTLGFTVNIGVSCNKLLAKMAGELEKPNKVITLFPQELSRKLWPLPVGELFMVGRATTPKLQAMGIRTIGDLAKADPAFLIRKLGKQGGVLWQFANGKDAGVISSAPAQNKGYSNAVTTPRDVTDFSYADQVLLSLCETVGTRLRRDEQAGSCLTIHLRTSAFENWSHQRQLSNATNVTQELYAGRGSFCAPRGTGKHRFGRSASRSHVFPIPASGRRVSLMRQTMKSSRSLIRLSMRCAKNTASRRFSARPFYRAIPPIWRAGSASTAGPASPSPSTSPSSTCSRT